MGNGQRVLLVADDPVADGLRNGSMAVGYAVELLRSGALPGAVSPKADWVVVDSAMDDSRLDDLFPVLAHMKLPLVLLPIGDWPPGARAERLRTSLSPA